MKNPYKMTPKQVLEDKNFWHLWIIVSLIGICSLFYYFGELIDFAGWLSLRHEIFYTVHDFHRLLFLAPIIYAGFVFRVKGTVIITLISFLIFIPRALFISPYPDAFIRMVIFTIFAGVMGVLVGLARNAIERKNVLEAKIKNERDMFYQILEGMRDGVIIVNSDYKILYLNPQIISEFGNGVGQYCYKYLYGFDNPCGTICKLRDIITGNTARWEYSYPDGRTYEIMASPVLGSDGSISQLAIMRNITKRKQLELELIKLNELKSDLLSNVSHELKSPLTSIKGIISSLLQKNIEWDEETRQMLLDGISEETDRLSSLVTNLLNMSKLEAGVWQPEKECHHITDIVNDAIEHQRWIYKNRVYRTYYSPILPEVFVDSNQIRQVLNNLLENAVAYSQDGTEISVSVKQVDKEVVISVADEGVGIPQYDIDKIFEKFYRGSQSRQKPGGIGLGLSICQSIVTAHGGRIWVDSEIGKGTTFYFTLPVVGNNISTKR